MGIPDILREDQRKHPNEGIDAHLGQQSRKDGGHSHRRGMVRGRQPEKQRKHCGFDTKSHDEKHADSCQQSRVLHSFDFQMQVGHVQGAGYTIQQNNAAQQHHGGNQIEREIFNRPINLRFFSTQNQQGKRRDQYQFIPDVQVEKVACEKRPAHGAEQEVQQGIVTEVFAALVNIREGVKYAAQPDDRGEQNHNRTDMVSDHGDAEGRGPSPHLGDQDSILQNGLKNQSGCCQ